MKMSIPLDSLLCCCSSCKPRYRRLVDAIYPRSLTDGLVNSNMQKLTYYAISHPEKLNRIAMYLSDRLSRDLYRQRFVQVTVTVDAINQLLKSCHSSPSLNQFIEHYLTMAQKLLETNDADMEKLATNLFVEFSAIQENAPAYHREYDFFISKFTSMCHASQGNRVKQQRYNGLRGLRAVIWKSIADELQTSIWEKQHLTKVIPSILFNLQEGEDEIDENVEQVGVLEYPYPDDDGANQNPQLLALQCLRELFGKCNFSMMKTVLDPIFKHCDDHNKWDPPAQFATHVFKAILYSIQSSNSFAVLQELIYHLENTPNSDVHVRIGITTVLSNIVNIAVATIGPLLLSIFNSLLKQLRASVEYENSSECTDIPSECQFQDTLINAMGVFASTLPDYQKVEIMMFTVSNIPTQNEDRPLKTSDAFVQKVLMKTLLKIATKYRTFYLSTVFSDSFLQTLLQLSVTQNMEVRLISQRILHTLFDRHTNLPKLEHLQYVEDVSDLQLSIEKCLRQDQLFMNKNINNILSTLFTFGKMADGPTLQDHLDALLCTMCLICVEIGHDTEVIELYRICFGFQQLALDTEQNLTLKKRAGLHNVVAKYMNFSSQLLTIPMLCQHVQKVIQLRAQRGHYLINVLATATIIDPLNASPPKAPIAQMDSEDDFTARPLGLENDSELLFDVNIVAEALKSANKNATALANPFEISKRTSDTVKKQYNLKKRSFAEPFESERNLERMISAEADDDDRSLSLDSFDWTPPETDDEKMDSLSWAQKLYDPEPEVTLEQLKLVANSDPDCSEEIRRDHQQSREILSKFRGKTAQELGAVLFKPKECDDNTNALLKDLLKEHLDWLSSHESARACLINSIDDLNFPTNFVS